MRVWEVRLKPLERLGFHRHVLDYFWVATTLGKARSHQQDGAVVEAAYVAGQTCHLTYDQASSRSTTWKILEIVNSSLRRWSFSIAQTRLSHCQQQQRLSLKESDAQF